MRPRAEPKDLGGFPHQVQRLLFPAGVRLSQQGGVAISYRAGTLSFLDTPTLYKPGSTVRGKVSAPAPAHLGQVQD